MRTLNIKRKMKKIFRTIGATIVAVLVLFTVVLTASVLLNLIVAKSLPDMSIPMYRACGMAIFSSLALVFFGLSVLKVVSSRLSRFLNKSDDNPDGESAREYVKKELDEAKKELDETKKELECRLHERYLMELRGFVKAMQTYKFDAFEKVLVRDFRNTKWRAAIFAWRDDREDHYPFRTTDNEGYDFCLPFNYITARLLDTTLSLEELLEQEEKKNEELNKDTPKEGDSENKESED